LGVPFSFSLSLFVDFFLFFFCTEWRHELSGLPRPVHLCRPFAPHPDHGRHPPPRRTMEGARRARTHTSRRGLQTRLNKTTGPSPLLLLLLSKPQPNLQLQIPTPREPSPDVAVQNIEYARPCPHCEPDNVYAWVCPIPIPDPAAGVGAAWRLDDGAPPGHAFCGNWCVLFKERRESRLI